MSLVRVQQGEPRGTEFFGSSFFLVRKDGPKSAAPPAGLERRLLATVRWTVATAVALPQQSESNRGSQKENWEVPVLFLVRKDGGKPERVSAVWLLAVVKLI